jgi:hypothetical protein
MTVSFVEKAARRMHRNVQLTAALALPLALVACASSAVRSQSPLQSAGLRCPHTDGFVTGPFVPTPDAARGIFLTVRSALFPDAPSLDAVHVSVGDSGDRYVVSESAVVPLPDVGGQHTPNSPGEEIVVTAGGGQLVMEIAKCTGAVSKVRFIR